MGKGDGYAVGSRLRARFGEARAGGEAGVSLWLSIALLAADTSVGPPVLSKEELAAITADLEARKVWDDAARETARSLSVQRMSYWALCLRNSRLRLHGSTEPVKTVATAIIGSCVDEEEPFRRSVILSYRGILNPIELRNLADHAVSEMRSRTKEAIISQLVTERLPPTR